jgi:hypothetical protein
MKKAILLLILSSPAIPLLFQYFEVNHSQAYASGSSSYQLMITDTDIAAVPDTPDINISTVEVDDDETNVYFRLNVTGSVSTTHTKGRRQTYGILLDYDQDEAPDHALLLEDGEFLWDNSTSLTNSSFSGSSIEWVVPKSIEIDSIFTLQAVTVMRARTPIFFQSSSSTVCGISHVGSSSSFSEL